MSFSRTEVNIERIDEKYVRKHFINSKIVSFFTYTIPNLKWPVGQSLTGMR